MIVVDASVVVDSLIGSAVASEQISGEVLTAPAILDAAEYPPLVTTQGHVKVAQCLLKITVSSLLLTPVPVCGPSRTTKWFHLVVHQPSE